MLAAARQEYDQQQRLVALAVAQTLRYPPRGPQVLAQTVRTYQAAAIQVSLEALAGILAEQGIDDATDATVSPFSLLTAARPLAGMLRKAVSTTTATSLVQTMVRDAATTARAVDMATRPAVSGYIRSLAPPSCGRCAVLAGRVYRYSQGFQRHPRCDCLMTPTTHDIGRTLVTTPRLDQITDLSASDRAAVNAGADLGQVVNVRRKAAGLVVGSSVMYRGQRLTPQGCLSLASDRADALNLLRAHGYVT